MYSYCWTVLGTFRDEGRSWNRFVLLPGPGYFIVGRLWVPRGIVAGIGYCVTGRASVLYCRAERGTVLQVTGLVSVLYCRVERGTVLQVGCPYFTVGRSGVLCYRTGVRTLL